MELTRHHNIDGAADPQAIKVAPPQKLPVSDNDPTRDISTLRAGERLFIVGLVVLALLALFALTLLMFTPR